jgi:hypothetical protein
MSGLEEYAVNGNHKTLHKVEHYFNYYEQYFNKYKRKHHVNVLEIGVNTGGSLDMWRNYFGPDAILYGIDINPETKQHESKNTKVIIIDQEDRDGLIHFFKDLPKFDIIIDDGGHTMQQQIKSFEALFPLLHPEGTYLVEDVQTSYWKYLYGGGLRKPHTFIEHSKLFLDYVNIDHFREDDTVDIYPPLKESLVNELVGVHYHDGLIFFEKGDKYEKLQFFYKGEKCVEYAGPLKILK